MPSNSQSLSKPDSHNSNLMSPLIDMSFITFIETKRLPEFSECYINYQDIFESLDTVCQLEQEKSCSIDFTILSPKETSDGRFHVLPVVSNEKFINSYNDFLTNLQKEISRTDNSIISRINEIKSQLIQSKINSINSPTTPNMWTTLFNGWVSSPTLVSDNNTFLTQLLNFETQLMQLRKNVISLNKFILSRIIDSKQTLIENSQFRHLLLQAELGYEVPALTSPFPIKGNQNRHHFSTKMSPAIEVIPASSKPSVNLFTEHLPKTNENYITLQEPPQKNTSQLKVVIPAKSGPTPITNTISSMRLDHSQGISQLHHYPDSLKSGPSSASSTASHASSCSSKYSRNELVRSTQFWCKTPSLISVLVNEIKQLRRNLTASNLKTRIVQEMSI